jgi:hypothetical protein
MGHTFIGVGTLKKKQRRGFEHSLRQSVISDPSDIYFLLFFNITVFFHSDANDSNPSPGWIFKRKSSTGCNLKSFDRYTFLMGVEFTSSEGPLTAVVTVSHKYYQTMMTLTKGTNVSKTRSRGGGGYEFVL